MTGGDCAVKCSELREQVTVHVALERRKSGKTWMVVASGSKGPKTIKANNKLDQNASITCLDGTYRTKGYASAKDDDGMIKRSDYKYSVQVQIICAAEEN